MSFPVEPSPIVLDVSFAVEVIEGGEASLAALADQVGKTALLLVPPHFWTETANALLRGRKLSAADVNARLERLKAVGVSVADGGLSGIVEAIGLADRHRLSVYDAAYLQLVLDVAGTRAPLDAGLGRAARAEGVPLLL